MFQRIIPYNQRTGVGTAAFSPAPPPAGFGLRARVLLHGCTLFPIAFFRGCKGVETSATTVV